jgi:hypothetical protein
VTYTYRVIVTGSVEPDATTREASLTVGIAPEVEVPTLVNAIGGHEQVSLTWNLVDGSTGYQIYKSEISGENGTEVTSVGGSVSATM